MSFDQSVEKQLSRLRIWNIVVGIVLAFVLEYLDKGQTEQNIPNSRYDPSVRVKAMVDALPDKEKEDSDKSEKKE